MVLPQSARPAGRRASLGVPEAREGWQGQNETQPSHSETDDDEEEWNYNLVNDEEEETSRIEDWILPQRLAKVLAKEPYFCATYRRLQQQLSLSHSALKRTVNAYGRTFRLHNNVVELRPQVALCDAHINTGDGCSDTYCLNLHICQQYVENSCNNARCGFGHKWFTNHNRRVFQDLYLHELSTADLHDVIAQTLSSTDQYGPLEICRDYNDDSCTGKCARLHICRKFVEGRAICEDENCTLSHDFTDSHNQCLLIINSLPANETPRDIVRALLDSNPDLLPNLSTVPNYDVTLPSPDNRESDNADSTHITQWSHEPFGDNEKTIVCENAVENLCPDEDTGCSCLHAPMPFHYQVSENGRNWYNLRHHQVQHLEWFYCDVQHQGVTLPPLKPSSIEPWWMELFKLLGGSRTWLVDFNEMILESGEQRLQLRRLCTQDMAGSTFLWYREISERQWQEYGQDQNEDSIINISSEDIEKKWQEDPNQTILCSGSLCSVSIDFRTMTESVSSTQNQRRVRRRPKPHMRHEPATQGAPCRVSDVATFDTEYKMIVHLLNHTATRYSNMKIMKLYNPLLRHSFQNRKLKLEEQLGSVEVRQLFQAVDPTLLSVLCYENFDWRHQRKRQSSMNYGRGCYFYSRACEAIEQGPQPTRARQHLVLAKVIVGKWTCGNRTMTAPPFINNTRCNTTTDKSYQPTVFVKYNSQEFYPEYLVILQ